MKKRLIEWHLPLLEISEQSAREKYIRHGHPSSVHIWWARRPLASSRVTNFAALVDLPQNKEEKEKLINLIKQITPWEAVKKGNNHAVQQARKILKEQWRKSPHVIDPFAGGGSIPLEALRIGCKTVTSDLNPVAVLIQKATMEWPQKFDIEINDFLNKKRKTLDGKRPKVKALPLFVEYWADNLLKETEKEMELFYPKEKDGSTPVGYIWLRTIPCQNPTCGETTPLVGKFWLAKKKMIAFKPLIKPDNSITFQIVKDKKINFNPDESTVNRAKVKCLYCKQITKASDTRRLAKEGKMGHQLAVIIHYKPGTVGKKYRVVNEEDIQTFEEAKDHLTKKLQELKWLEDPLPHETTPPIGTYGVDFQRYTVHQEWRDLFNARQKLTLITFLDNVKKSFSRIKDHCKDIGIKNDILDEFAKAVLSYISLAFCRLVGSLSISTTWSSTSESIRDIFMRPALGMVWDYVESNPFSGITGSFKTRLKPILTYLNSEHSIDNKEVICLNTSATEIPYPDNSFDAVFTDPPYYDNVPYAALSDFYYVWLKRAIGDVYPDLFATPLTPKAEETVADKIRQENPKQFFENQLSKSFGEFYRVLKPDGIAVIVYAYKTTDGWETMVNALINAGLVVTASWPIHTEMKSRFRAASSAALASSIYMVCRKIKREPVGYFNEIQPKVANRIRRRLKDFWDQDIKGGDFFISAIGPAMEIFSRYERVENYSGEQIATINFFEFIRQISTEFIVNRLLKEKIAKNIDKQSQFYLTYRWTYLDNQIPYDDARKLATACGIEVEKLWTSTGFVRKTGSKISVIGPSKRSKITNLDSMINVMHQALIYWSKEDQDQVNTLLETTGQKNNPSFWQFCQAVSESLLEGTQEKKWIEGFLLGKERYIKISEQERAKDEINLNQYFQS